MIDKETSVGEQNSQFDLNMNPPDDDPMMSVIDIPTSLMQDLHKQWKDSLIVRLLRKNIGYKALDSRLKTL